MKRLLALLLTLCTLLSLVVLPASAKAEAPLRPYDPTLDTEDTEDETNFWIAMVAMLLGIGAVSAGIGILCTALLLLSAVAIVTVNLIGSLRINRRYRELTRRDTVILDVLAILLSLFGLGTLYLTVMALVNHSKI